MLPVRKSVVRAPLLGAVVVLTKLPGSAAFIGCGGSEGRSAQGSGVVRARLCAICCEAAQRDRRAAGASAHDALCARIHTAAVVLVWQRLRVSKPVNCACQLHQTSL